MNIEEVRALCLSLPHVEESTPFVNCGSDDVAYKIGGKMFALLSVEGDNIVALKCEPAYAIELRERLPGVVEPAYHFNKAHWNQVRYDSRLVAPALMRALVEHAYGETAKTLTKKLRASLGIEPC